MKGQLDTQSGSVEIEGLFHYESADTVVLKVRGKIVSFDCHARVIDVVKQLEQ